MTRILSFPTNVGLKQTDWVNCLLEDNYPEYVREYYDPNIPLDLTSGDSIVLDGCVFSIWKRVAIPLDRGKYFDGHELVYLAWRLNDTRD